MLGCAVQRQDTEMQCVMSSLVLVLVPGILYMVCMVELCTKETPNQCTSNFILAYPSYIHDPIRCWVACCSWETDRVIFIHQQSSSIVDRTAQFSSHSQIDCL
jgi:hypothetical protein